MSSDSYSRTYLCEYAIADTSLSLAIILATYGFKRSDDRHIRTSLQETLFCRTNMNVECCIANYLFIATIYKRCIEKFKSFCTNNKHEATLNIHLFDEKVKQNYDTICNFFLTFFYFTLKAPSLRTIHCARPHLDEYISHLNVE